MVNAILVTVPYMRAANDLFDVFNGRNMSHANRLGGPMSRHRSMLKINSHSADQIAIIRKIPNMLDKAVYDVKNNARNNVTINGKQLTVGRNCFTWQTRHIADVICYGTVSLMTERERHRPNSRLDLSLLSTDVNEHHYGSNKQLTSQYTASEAARLDSRANVKNILNFRHFIETGKYRDSQAVNRRGNVTYKNMSRVVKRRTRTNTAARRRIRVHENNSLFCPRL